MHANVCLLQLKVQKLHSQAFLFNDYWEDIGTIRSFFDANLALTEHVSCIILSQLCSNLMINYSLAKL